MLLGVGCAAPNQPATIDGPRVIPEAPFQDAILTADVRATDPEGAPVQLDVRWFANGRLVGEGITMAGGGLLRVGDRVEAMAIAFDGVEVTDALSDPVIVANRPPSLSQVSVIPSPIFPGDTPTCSWSFNDLDGHRDTSTATWWINGRPVQTGPTLTAAFAIGDTLHCDVVAYDGHDEGDRGYASTTVVGGNVLILVADDLGTDKVAGYGEHPSPPNTPVLDSLIDRGVLFRRAYTAPVCSPTRAMILSGRFPRQTGIGTAINVLEGTMTLDPDRTSIADLAGLSRANYARIALGKWHLGVVSEAGTLTHPQEVGFDVHLGPPGNLMGHAFDGLEQTYFDYEKVVDGVIERSTVYATTDIVDDAMALISERTEPWLLYVAFNAPHGPFHRAPDHLHTVEVTDLPPEKYASMVEAMDTEIGRLLDSVDLSETTVIFLGDNGTPEPAVLEPWPYDRAKTTLYEGGIRVPMIVAGAAVRAPGTATHALVATTDVFATVGELVGVDARPLAPDSDARSFVSVLRDPSLPHRDDLVLSRFKPNGPVTPDTEFDVLQHMATEGHIKLIREIGLPDQLFDLEGRIYEDVDLLAQGEAISPELHDTYLRLAATLDAIGWL